MAHSFREHQLIKIAQYIRSYYSGSFYIEQSGPFRFDAGKACYDNIDNVRWKQLLSQINKEIKRMGSFTLASKISHEVRQQYL